jgi:type IV pilus assembly protein PilV
MMNYARKHQKGAVLLEAMIAILLFSMGILALVGLQAASVSNTSSAKYRAEAAYLVEQITSNMWASGNTATLATFACNPCTAGAGGNVTTQQWAAQVQATLPKVGTAGVAWPIIAFSPAPNTNRVTVTVFWKAPTDDPAALAHSHQMTTQICPGNLCS